MRGDKRMTEGQKKARSLLRGEREKKGLSTDIDALIETYRGYDPEYAEKLEGLIGPSKKKSPGR